MHERLDERLLTKLKEEVYIHVRHTICKPQWYVWRLNTQRYYSAVLHQSVVAKIPNMESTDRSVTSELMKPLPTKDKVFHLYVEGDEVLSFRQWRNDDDIAVSNDADLISMPCCKNKSVYVNLRNIYTATNIRQ